MVVVGGRWKDARQEARTKAEIWKIFNIVQNLAARQNRLYINGYY